MALQRAAAKGTPVNRLGYGYRKVYDTEGDATVEQVPAETAVIRQAYGLAIGYRGYKSIADELNIRGYHTRNGSLWSTQTVKLLLTNPAVRHARIDYRKAELLSSG